MKVYNDESLSLVFEKAKLSKRKRAHLNLHSSYGEKVQRLFIALTKGSYVPPHYHECPHQWEMFVVIDGVVKVKHYNIDGSVYYESMIGDNQSAKVIEILPNEIHSVECVSDTALLLEIKEGPFDPDLAKVMI